MAFVQENGSASKPARQNAGENYTDTQCRKRVWPGRVYQGFLLWEFSEQIALRMWSRSPQVRRVTHYRVKGVACRGEVLSIDMGERMLKIDPAQAVYGDGERAVVFKNGERVGVIRINKDDSAWLFRVAPDKASIRLTMVQGEPVVDLTSEELLALHQAVSAKKVEIGHA